MSVRRWVRESTMRKHLQKSTECSVSDWEVGEVSRFLVLTHKMVAHTIHHIE